MLMHSANAVTTTPKYSSIDANTKLAIPSRKFCENVINTSSDYLQIQPRIRSSFTNEKSEICEEQSQEIQNVDLLTLMNEVGTSIKNDEFSSTLPNKIAVICQQLKIKGQHLEQSHKKLNKIFVALRQACCRDTGHLGTPCRIKMMELVELRAMGWRLNLAHSQYYLDRLHSGQEQQLQANAFTNPILSKNISKQQQYPVSQSSNNNTVTNNALLKCQVSEQQYSIPPPFLISPTPMPVPIINQSLPLDYPTSNGNWRPNSTSEIKSATLANTPSYILPHSSHLIQSIPLSQIDLQSPDFMLNTQNSNKKCAIPSSKSQQFCEDMVIRNCDSGKIMGVKGRRVAQVEEFSSTVISFQKVEPKSKDRVLTISGSTIECIEEAKKLILETIRRNISPNRANTDVPEEKKDLIKSNDQKVNTRTDNIDNTPAETIKVNSKKVAQTSYDKLCVDISSIGEVNDLKKQKTDKKNNVDGDHLSSNSLGVQEVKQKDSNSDCETDEDRKQISFPTKKLSTKRCVYDRDKMLLINKMMALSNFDLQRLLNKEDKESNDIISQILRIA